MDFSLSEEQVAIRDLAREVLTDHCTPERLREVEDSDSPGFDRALWAKLATAGLLGVSIPEEHGGAGLGYLELCLFLEEVGRTVAPIPALGGLVLGARPLAQWGTAEQQQRWLPAIASGEALVAGALVEPLGEPGIPATRARRDGDNWILDGVKVCVQAGTYADRLLVSATTDTGAALFLVDPSAGGVRMQPEPTITYAPEAYVALEDVRVSAADLVGAPDGEALAGVLAEATAATAAVLLGVCAGALRLTAEYTKTREQFGRPIALFQAVGQRAADSYIDTTGIRLTTQQAVWLLHAGRDCAKEVAVAKYFAAEAGQRVVRAAQHLHGGMGVSREYPVHRYYIWAKQLELFLGSGTRQLVALGRLLADEPVGV